MEIKGTFNKGFVFFLKKSILVLMITLDQSIWFIVIKVYTLWPVYPIFNYELLDKGFLKKLWTLFSNSASFTLAFRCDIHYCCLELFNSISSARFSYNVHELQLSDSSLKTGFKSIFRCNIINLFVNTLSLLPSLPPSSLCACVCA